MKNVTTMTVLAAVFASQMSFANDAPLIDESVSFAFANSTRLNVHALGEQEMKETEGAFWNYVGLGFVGGGFGGLNYAYSVPSSQRTYGGWAMAIGSGAVGTMITGTPFGATRTALYGGSIAYVGGQWSTSSWGRR
ncbi:MAG TPA: hypothetical protein PKI88_05180 [Agitococcus sp.]|nr:hypothetical protein [Agitococcus sp.]